MRKTFLVMTFIPMLAVSARAETPVTGSGAWYYEIGGAEPVSAAPNANVTAITISANAALRMPNSCSSLDPVLSVSNILDDIKSGIDQFEDSMVLAANSAIAALPSIILQRANPGLYDHFQNAMLNATARVNVAVKSCEEMVEDARNGENPFKDWVHISRGYSWNAQLAAVGNDPVTARDAVDTDNGDAGVPWLGGARGGAGQPPIQVIRDTVHAGYNVTLNRAADASGAPPAATPTPRLVELWAAPEDAGTWAREVLGDMDVQTCEGCVPQTAPGIGLLPKYEAEKQTIITDLAAIVSGASAPTLANLKQVSAPQVVVTRQIIDALKNVEDAQELGVLLNRLAADVASARTVERALAVRRLIVTGKKVPEIAAYGAAVDENLDALQVVEREIDNFLYEHRIRRELVSKTAQLVLARNQAAITRSLDLPTAIEQDPDPLVKAKVKP